MVGSRPIGSARAVPAPRRIPYDELDRARPVWLVDIAPLGGGPVLHAADVNITVQGVRYEDYLDRLSGLGSELSRVDSSGLAGDVAIELDNARFRGYPYLAEAGEDYPFEGAACAVRCAWLDVSSDGGALLAVDDVFTGTVEGAQGITLMGLTLTAKSNEFKGDI
jgi:hypothetical protein